MGSVATFEARRAGRASPGFSLTELLVALGIIAILLALLLPVINRARAAARAVYCQATLQQWSTAFQAYVTGNDGRSFELGDLPSSLDKGNNPLVWWEILRPHHPDSSRTLLCPEATDPANVTPANALQAWGPQRFWDTPTQVRGPYVGSYGFNGWVYRTSDRSAPNVRLPARESSRVPLVFDCADMQTWPKDDDPPRLYHTGAPLAGMSVVALERHQRGKNGGGGVNVAFLDGHAEYVPVPQLWQLKWSEAFNPKEVVIQR